jgi:DNA polymerase-1
LGCASVQVSGQSAANVERSQLADSKVSHDVPPLAPGQYDLMVVGDLPGIDDDRKDMAWQDNNGVAVIEYLKKAGFDLDRVWMTKAVRCRPRKRGRKPTVQEIKTCRTEYLLPEIKAIQPKVVILIGAPSLKTFNLTGRGSLNAIHGQVYDLQFPDWDDGPTFKVIPTLNPSQFFYKPNPKLQARIGHDYVVAKDVIDGKPPTPHFVPDWHLIDTKEKLEWLEKKLLSTSMFGWDTELPSLRYRKSPLLCFSFAWGWEPDECAVIPVLRHDPEAADDLPFHSRPAFGAENEALLTKFLKKVFLTPHIAKAAHNFKFDLNVLRWNYGIIPEGFLFDTWTMKHQMDENPPSNLEFCCDCEFAWGDYAEEVRKITGSGKVLKATYDKVPDKLLWPYAATDALGTYRLCAVYAQQLQAKANLWKFHQEESEPIIRSLAQAEYKGALMDLDVLDELMIQFEAEQKQLRAKTRSLTWPDFNPNSNPQVLKAFFNLGVTNLELEDEAAASGYSANKKKLTEIVERKKQPQANLATWIMSYRNRQKMISTYLVNAKNDLDRDGRLRYSWVIAGPVTGRLSCTFFHQIPKIDESVVLDANEKYIPFAVRKPQGKVVMRDMFIAPPGYKYVYGDYSQVELWIMALLSNDAEMLRILRSGGDLHRASTYEFLSTVWPDLVEAAISKFNRTEIGKKVNFGFCYGSEGHALVKNCKWKDENNTERDFTWDMLNRGMERWKKRFSGVGNFIDLTPDTVRSFGGTATNVFGRERHFGPLLSAPNEFERGKAERECVNFFIQSVAASLTNRTIIEVDKMLQGYGIGEDLVCLVNTVHDSVAYEVKDEYVDWFVQALEAISLRPVPELGNTQFKIDCGVGENWCDAEMAA